MEWWVLLVSDIDRHAVLQAVGVIGFIFYIAGFAALQFGLLDGNGSAYTILNILGASCVLLSLLSAFNLASLLIQVSWISIGLFGLARRFRRPPQTVVVFRSRRSGARVIEVADFSRPSSVGIDRLAATA